MKCYLQCQFDVCGQSYRRKLSLAYTPVGHVDLDSTLKFITYAGPS